MRRLSLLIAAILILPATASAMPGMGEGGGKPQQSPEEKFAAMDKNGDGLVSWDEFFEFYPFMHESAFKNIDKDGSKTLSKEEWLNFSSKHSRDMDASGMGAGSMGGKGPVMREMFEGGGQAEPARGGEDSKGRLLFEFKPKDEKK